MPNYNTQLQSNNTDLQAILNSINELPEATGGIELPELTNEGTAIDLLSGKQLINSNGSVVTGTFSIDSELATQDDLIAQLSAAVNNLPDAGNGEPILQNKTVTPSTSKQTVTADSGYDGLDTVTVNAMTTATQATPSISVNSSGLITASSTQTAGYVAAGTKSATKQLTTQAAQTITPTTTDKTIASERYLTGTQTIKGDANLVAGNIKSGVSIFGVAGSYEGSGGGSSGMEYEIITIPAGATSATYALPRITNAFGTVNTYFTLTSSEDYTAMVSIEDTLCRYVCEIDSLGLTGESYVDFDSVRIFYNKGVITWESGPVIMEPIVLLLVNDPSKDILYTCTAT